jgi:hypothetical protein
MNNSVSTEMTEMTEMTDTTEASVMSEVSVSENREAGASPIIGNFFNVIVSVKVATS